MPRASKGRIAMFEYQEPVVLNQANPVQNTWYPVLPATDYVRIYKMGVAIADVDETLEMRVIDDGVTIVPLPLAATFGTQYAGIIKVNPVARLNQVELVAITTARGLSFTKEGHNVAVDVRKTTAAGAGNLTAIVTFGVLTDAD